MCISPRKNGEAYRYLANNANFESYIKIVKVDAETGENDSLCRRRLSALPAPDGRH